MRYVVVCILISMDESSLKSKLTILNCPVGYSSLSRDLYILWKVTSRRWISRLLRTEMYIPGGRKELCTIGTILRPSTKYVKNYLISSDERTYDITELLPPFNWQFAQACIALYVAQELMNRQLVFYLSSPYCILTEYHWHCVAPPSGGV